MINATPELLPTDDEFFGVKCKKCGWVGSSFESKGGESNADAGDFSDITCPHCCEDGFYGEVLEDATENELCSEIVRLRRSPTPDTRLPEEIRGDGPCKNCGTFENIIWFTDSDLWNKLNIPGILCIACFVKEIYSHGVNPTGWKLVPEDRVNAPDTRLREAAKEFCRNAYHSPHCAENVGPIGSSCDCGFYALCRELSAIEGKEAKP